MSARELNFEPAAWTIRAYEQGDTDALCDLFERSFGRPMRRAEWLWKHNTLPSPVPNVWLAEHNHRPIFHTSGIPLRYKLLDAERVGMVSVDTMTAPEWRRRGLLTAVGSVAYDAYRAAGIPFVIGIINDKWGSRANALGWQELFRLEWQIRPLRPETFAARRLRAPTLDRETPARAVWNTFWDRRIPHDPQINVRWIETAGAELDALWKRARDSYAFSLVRDRAWVQWRYLDAPLHYRVALAEKGGAPMGYAATRVLENARGRVGVIAELFVAREDVTTLGTLLHFLTAHWRAAGMTQAATVNLPATWMYHAFRRAGFRWSVGDFSVQLIPLDPTLTPDRMRDASQWYMAGGDYDDV